MFYKLLISVLVLTSLPAMAHAQINSHTSASANSGGNMVGPGGNVVTGDESASVQVTTNTSSSGTSSVYIKTDVNGDVHEEAVEVRGATNVKVEAVPAKTTIQVQEGTPPTTVKSEVVSAAAHAPSDTSISGVATAAVEASAAQAVVGPGFGTQIILAVRSFFAGLLSWFA